MWSLFIFFWTFCFTFSDILFWRLYFEKLNKKKQFFFYVTKPVYTRNKEFAFIYIDANKKQYFDEQEPQEYYGYVLVVFRKVNNEWKQIAKKDWIILLKKTSYNMGNRCTTTIFR